MTAFIVSVVVFIAIAFALLLPPLLRKFAPSTVDITSLPIYREQLQELQADFANGAILEPQYREAEQELKRRLLDETRDPSVAGDAAPPSRWLALAIAFALPLASFGLYKLLGEPEAFSSTHQVGAPINAENITPEQFATMTQRLAVRLREQPNDAQGWTMLAKAYMALGRGSDAVMAYDRAVLQAPDNGTLLAEYAFALSAQNNNSYVGRPREVIARGLQAEPNNPRILALAGSAAFEAKDYPAAIGYWQKLLTQIPKDSEFTSEIVASIDAARSASGEKPAPTAAASSVSGVVSLSDAVKDKAAAGDTLFIYARAAGANAPKMPLAVWRGAVKDLPKNFTLDDSMAMTPAMVLSKFEQVTVEARVSKSGNAITQSGDLGGAGVTVKPGAKDIKVLIDRVVP